jgi:outer membrane lipoprotein-sorting protein
MKKVAAGGLVVQSSLRSLRFAIASCFLFGLIGSELAAEEPDPKALIRAAMDQWRGSTSHSEMTMTIHRPGWERTMSMRAWTEGEKKSLVRVTAPNKEAGTGTLLDDEQMWTYSPKINRIIKVPSSMMSQSWMGSDFSNKDISKSTDIIDQYEHTLLETQEEDGHTVYVIEAIPHEEAAVVWGREILVIRGDKVLLEEEFWDQEGVLVKKLETTVIAEMGGRTVAKTMRMGKPDRPDEWTEMTVDMIEFDLDLDPNVFTRSNLRNPRQ